MYKPTQEVLIATISCAIALALASCAQNGSSSETSSDTAVAATVNGRSIMLKEVEHLISQQASGQQSQMTPLELAQARLQVLDSLIQKEVLFQRAEKEKLLPSEDEVSQFINNQKQQSHMTDEEFQQKLKEQNMTTETLHEEARKSIAIQKLQDKYNTKISVSDKQVEDFYNNNKQEFVNQRGVGLAMIVVDPADNSAQGIQNDAKGEAEAKLKIDGIYQQLKNGAEFADVARARSEDAKSLVQGGDIGFATEADLKQNSFPSELISQFFGSLQVGSFTAPVQFSGRWYIFKLKEKRLQVENLTLNSPGVRQQITDALTNQTKQVLNTALLEEAMAESKIVNNLARKMLESPNNLSGPRPASSASPTVAASPSGGSAAPSPSAAGSSAGSPPPASSPQGSATFNGAKRTSSPAGPASPRFRPSPNQ